MFQKCIEAQFARDIPRARIYANECAEIRKIARIVLSSQLALERVILRLQTIEQFGEVLTQIAPVIDVVEEMKDKVSGLIPEVANELEQVNSMLKDMSLEAGEIESENIDVETANEEAKKIMLESMAIAEEKMKETFPDIKDLQVSKMRVIPISEGGEDIKRINLEELVLEYIKSNNGYLSISKCASILGVPPKKVKEAVEKLRNDGKIVVE
ncbi:MAG: hypothetical protein QXR82_03095 [Candidatus Bathyarchaeia archaeon]|nr:hypothetical protein [Candidatus Bathyarchaeota archaeon]